MKRELKDNPVFRIGSEVVVRTGDYKGVETFYEGLVGECRHCMHNQEGGYKYGVQFGEDVYTVIDEKYLDIPTEEELEIFGADNDDEEYEEDNESEFTVDEITDMAYDLLQYGKLDSSIHKEKGNRLIHEAFSAICEWADKYLDSIEKEDDGE